MPTIVGKHIREVWDYRLSEATPLIDRRSGTWRCQIWSKNSPDFVDGAQPAEPLEEHDTGIPSEPNDAYDEAKLKVCFEWFLAKRDQYARPDLEEIKPLVAQINEANAKLAERGAA